MPTNRLDARETLRHQIAVLVAHHGLTTATAYDLLKAAGYNMTTATDMINEARADGTSVKDYLAKVTR